MTRLTCMLFARKDHLKFVATFNIFLLYDASVISSSD